MRDLKFEWDEAKDSANRRKHGVALDEACSVFSDERALLLDDPDHSPDKDRFILLGLSFTMRLLVVHHTLRAGGDVLRIISARKATRAERDQYIRRWRP